MSKDCAPQGLSRILKLSLEAAFGMKTQPHATEVRTQHECKAEVAKGPTRTSDSVSKLEVGTMDVDFQDGLKDTDRRSCAVSSRPVCKSGRGRGRKLVETSSKPGFLLKSNTEFAESNSCENQPVSIHSQSVTDISVVRTEMAEIADFSVAAAGKDVTAKQFETTVLSTNKDRQRLTLKTEDACELPDLVKCQISVENMNRPPRNQELNIDMGAQELTSNSMVLDCPGFNNQAVAIEKSLPSKSLTPQRNTSTRGKYHHGLEKAAEAAFSVVAPWRGQQTPVCTDFSRFRRAGQPLQAHSRNDYARKEPFSSVLSNKQKVTRPLKIAKQPVFEKNNGTYRGNQRCLRTKFPNKQYQHTFRAQPHELNKGDRGRQAKQQVGDARKAGQQVVNDGKANEEAINSRSKHEIDESKSNHWKVDDTESKQHGADGGNSKQHEIDDIKFKQHETNASISKHQEADDRNSKQQKNASTSKHQEVDDSKLKQQEADDSKSKQEADDSKSKQEADDSKSKQQEADDSKSKQQEADDSKSKQEADDSKSKQEADDSKSKQEADDSKSKQQEADDSKSKQQEADDSKSKQQEADDSKSKQQEADDSKSKQQVEGHEADKQEGDDTKANQHEVDDSKLKQQEADDCKSKQQVEGHEADKQEGDDTKANQHEVDDSKLKQQEPESKSTQQTVPIKVNDYIVAQNPSNNLQGEMKNMKDLEPESRCDEMSCQLVQETSETCATDTTTNRSCQDTSEMKERHRPISGQNIESTSFQNKDDISTQNIDNSVLNASINTGTLSMPGQVLEASSEFVGWNYSIHTLINAIYQSYEHDSIQDDDKSAGLPASSLEMRESTDINNLPGETPVHAQESNCLECFNSPAEKDIVAICEVSAAQEKGEVYTSASVQKGGDQIYVYVDEREVIKSASEQRVGDIVSAFKERRDNGLSASEQKEVGVYEESTSAVKEKREDNKSVSEVKGELCVFTSQENGDIVSSKQKEVISVSEQNGEVKASASKEREDALRSHEVMLVKNENYETVKIKQDLANDLESETIIPQKTSPLQSCHLPGNCSKCYADVPTAIGSEHSSLCETDLTQNPLKKSAADHCSERSPKMMSSWQIMSDQPVQSNSNVPTTSHQYNSSSSYECSRHTDSYPGPASSLNTSEEKQNNSSFAPFFQTREFSLPAETLGSEAAMDRIITFLGSCSKNIQQYMSQYNENHPLDVTIRVSLTHPPLSDYVPRLPHYHGNPCQGDRSKSSCPLPPMFPYAGWLPTHPYYWNWWPWLEGYSANAGTSIGSVPPNYQCCPAMMCTVPSLANDPLPSDANNPPPTQADGNRQGPASSRAVADQLSPRMYSCSNPGLFKRQQEPGRAVTCTVDPSHGWQGYWSPEMASNLHSVNAKVVDNMTNLQTSKPMIDDGIWNEVDLRASSGQLAESVSPFSQHQSDYLLGNLSTESVALSSVPSEETSKGETDRHKYFRMNSVSSCLLNERLTNNWVTRATPPAGSIFRNWNVGVSPRTASPAVPPDLPFSRRDAVSPAVDSTSNPTCRSRGFQPIARFREAQSGRRKSAPYHMTKPWTDHQTQNRWPRLYPLTVNMSTGSQTSSNGEDGQLESETASPSPLSVAAGKKSFRDWAYSFVARSRSYQYMFIDSHCHIDLLYSRLDVPAGTQFSKFREQHAETFPCNYEGCVAIFCNISTFNADNPLDEVLKTVSMEAGVWLAAGCHPKQAVQFTEAHLTGLRCILKHPKVVALGEIGLDYSGGFGQHSEIQKRVFRQQLQLAVEMRLPLVIHCRDADDDCLEILTQMVPCNYKIHAHCFTKDISMAMRWMVPFPNLFLGLTPLVTYNSAVGAINTATFIPLDRLLLETDAPYFLPVGVKQQDMMCSHPGFALLTAERVAKLKRISVDEVLKACRENTHKMYGI